MIQTSQMRREILEIPSAVERLLSQGDGAIRRAASALSDHDPAIVITAARGTSDHAALYFKYLCEMRAGVPVASIGPSVTSIFGGALRLRQAACLAISQSGQSPDIVSIARMAREGGALSIALTNHPESALAQASAQTLAQHAGPELSVAATKTFVTSLVSTAWLLAEWQGDRDLRAAIHALPEVLERAIAVDWSPFAAQVGDHKSLFCLGRGPTLAISNEAALKLKETCLLHAESFSSAEVLHGPMAIVDRGFPVLALAAADPAEAALAEVADNLAEKGAQVFATSAKVRSAHVLPTVRSAHALTDPIALIASFYAMVEPLARARGLDPDAPRHLRKVTETL